VDSGAGGGKRVFISGKGGKETLGIGFGDTGASVVKYIIDGSIAAMEPVADRICKDSCRYQSSLGLRGRG
jgi:hypothetical protein